MHAVFDWNEWFFIVSSMIAFSLFLVIRKYFPTVIVIIIWLYVIWCVGTIDYFLVASPFKLYYFFDNPTYELTAVIGHWFMYPCSALLFLYGYDKWGLYGKRTVGYIFCWTLLAVLFEWICLKNHVLTYTGWKLYYSVPVYPLAAISVIIVFRFSKRKLQQLPPHNGSG